MAERCCMGVVINDESFNYFTARKEAIIEIHLCFVHSSEALQFSVFEESIASWPLVLEDSPKPIDSQCFIFVRMF